jgi:proton-dependent oligopeptide transporter, POT family
VSRDRFPLSAFLKGISSWTYYGTVNIFNNYIRQRLPNNSTTGAVIGDAATRARGVAGALGKGQKISFAIRTVSFDRLEHYRPT